ncbi:hypothetical protein BUALT_Bualt18G0030800 [Buddleja alternifolia]|uniref:RING-type domain-containing protein n=1 Tax=Buddleja alternifolia TaxID=168488 RepID=A0AAV6W8H0_9LAMI|nr:hypothetical protein BUALT_Bualt18G0030800 [Buddleja alternifolia]
MSRSSSNFSAQENWRPGQEDFWLYLPAARTGIRTSDHLYPRGRSQVPWWLSEERSLGGPINYGLPSFPSSAPPRSSLQLVLINEYNTYPRAQNHTPHGNQITALDEESRWSSTEEEQKQAAISSKLRKQLYSPHMSNIVKRLGTSKSTGSSSSSVNKKYDDDDDGKRCAVCLDDFVTKEFVTVTPCNHMFHEECIVPWVKTNRKCPVCRFLIAP